MSKSSSIISPYEDDHVDCTGFFGGSERTSTEVLSEHQDYSASGIEMTPPMQMGDQMDGNGSCSERVRRTSGEHPLLPFLSK